MNIPNIKELKPSQCREVVIKKNYPEFYQYLIDNYPNISFSEKLYWYYNNIHTKPVCSACGKSVKFINSTLGYAQYCSKSCANKSTNKIEKTKHSCIEKYGGVAPICSDSVKTKMTSTMLDRYGVANCQQNKEISKKTQNTIIEKYGGQGNASAELKQKYVSTCINKYGVDNSSKADHIKERISTGKRQSIIDTSNDVIEYVETEGKLMCVCKCPHAECNKCSDRQYTIETTLLANRLSHNIERCTKLLPYKPMTSTYELAIQELLDSFSIEYQTNVRNIISKELDIYIPSKNIAIEFNGIYHHSDAIKPNNYHNNKFKECQKRGIQLISIWEDQYLSKYNIVRSLLLSKLGIYETKLYARKCDLCTVDAETANIFYSHNHIQGKCNASVHYALRYDDNIVAMMSFGKRALGKEYDDNWELIRYCSKINTSVIGGVSKLFNHFIKSHNPKCIISWSSNDISDGNMYKLLNFDYANESLSYWYISNNMKRYHRSNFSKSNLIKKKIITNADTRSEHEITKSLGFKRIFDSGQTKWIWNK